MRRFVVVGHKAVTTGDFKLDDTAGGAGRLDILVRCVNSAFFLSHDIRKDTELFLVLLGGCDPPKTVRFAGSELRYLNPDERSTSALIRNALLKKPGEGEARSSPGIYVSKASFADVMGALSGTGSIIYMKESGADVRGGGLPPDPVFVLSDNVDLTEEEERVLSGHGAAEVSIGPHSLHADHCIVIAHNEMDRGPP